MRTIVRLYRNGSSSVVTIHPQILRALKWHRGDELIVEPIGDGLVVSKWPMLPGIEKQRGMFRARGAKRPKA